MRLLLSDADLGRGSPGHNGTIDAESLARAYAYPDLSRLSGRQTWVRANFIATLDGAAAGEDGRSGSLGSGGDREVFNLLRALADVVLVGAGTARTEGYRRVKVRAPWPYLRKDRAMHPTIAVFSRSGDVPPGLSTARDDAGEVLLVTCRRAGAEAIDVAQSTLGKDQVIIAGDESVDLATAVDLLADRGLNRILCEGGPHLMSDLTASGRLDELCLTIAPTLVGGDQPRITAGNPLTATLLPRLLIESEGALLGRWSRNIPQT